MHIEILVEDSSGERLLDCLLPQILGPHGSPHTWRLHAYKGIGRIPPNLRTSADPAKRILLDHRATNGLGRLLDITGYKQRPYFKAHHLEPLLAGGVLRMTVPDKPRSPRQQYVLTDTGVKL